MKQTKKIFVIAHDIRSLHNVGSIFRTADIFNISKIYLSGYTGTPPRPEISKVALGAEEWITWENNKNLTTLIKKLKKKKIKIYALETGKNTKNITTFKPQFPCALILGHEVEGINQEILNQADEIISIPMFGKKSSLNVSVATGIALYELNKYR